MESQCAPRRKQHPVEAGGRAVRFGLLQQVQPPDRQYRRIPHRGSGHPFPGERNQFLPARFRDPRGSVHQGVRTGGQRWLARRDGRARRTDLHLAGRGSPQHGGGGAQPQFPPPAHALHQTQVHLAAGLRAGSTGDPGGGVRQTGRFHLADHRPGGPGQLRPHLLGGSGRSRLPTGRADAHRARPDDPDLLSDQRTGGRGSDRGRHRRGKQADLRQPPARGQGRHPGGHGQLDPVVSALPLPGPGSIQPGTWTVHPVQSRARDRSPRRQGASGLHRPRVLQTCFGAPDGGADLAARERGPGFRAGLHLRDKPGYRRR